MSLLRGGRSWKQQRPFKHKPPRDDDDDDDDNVDDDRYTLYVFAIIYTTAANNVSSISSTGLATVVGSSR